MPWVSDGASFFHSTIEDSRRPERLSSDDSCCYYIILGVVVPIIPALLPLIHGYTITSGPFGYCVARNKDTTYFTLVLPLSILMAITTSVFVILFWRILKVIELPNYVIMHAYSNSKDYMYIDSSRSLC